ncbi:hypothetical protein RND81_07G042100 [Saponaria officinalis]|uniref:Zinc finger GRF-type domain-containing protein n=1 Tax=Saponaria officinalis TaxID=3572 RepID=A0AAW1JNL6_SAPOF
MSTATSSTSSRNPIKCKCSVPPALLTSWTSHNPERRFLACKFRFCKYFRWVDEDQSEWQRDVINQLLLEKKLLQSDNDNLRVKKSQLVEQVIELRAENHLMKEKVDIGEVRIHTVPLERRMKGLQKFLYAIVFALVLVYVMKQV